MIGEDDRIDIHYDLLPIITVYVTASIQDERGDYEGTQTSLVVVIGYGALLSVKLQFGPILIGGGVKVHGYHQTLFGIGSGGIYVERAMIKVDYPAKVVRGWCHARSGRYILA